MKYAKSNLRIAALVLSGCLVFDNLSLWAQEAAAASDETVAVNEITPELMRSFLHLQEQVHATQLAVERSRMESELAAERNAEALNARLQVIEKAMEQTQQANSAAMADVGDQIRKSNQLTVWFAGIFALLGFAALGATGWFVWKMFTRAGVISESAGFLPMLPSPAYGSLGRGTPSARLASSQLMNALGRLEHRIADLEGGHQDEAAEEESGGTPGEKGAAPTARVDRAGIAKLIREGEALLAREEAEKAIEHFDAVLAKHPGHPEVLLHKGAALERLRRDQEAIECYDQAIRADRTLTMAYLHKGGLYNRMERFNEAMECYEQALKVQEERAPINP